MIRANYIKILFLIIVFVLLAVSVLTYRNLNNYITEVNLIRHSNTIFESAERVLSTIKDAEIGHRGYQLTRDTTYLDPYYSSLVSLPGEINKLDSLVKDNENQHKKVDTLEALINSQFLIIAKILSNAQRSSLYMDRYESGLLAEGRLNMVEIRGVVRRIVEAEEEIFDKRISYENDFRNIAPISLFIYALIALGGVTILFIKVLEALHKRKLAEDELWMNLEILRKEVRIREFTQKTLRNILDNSLNGIMAFKAVRNKQKSIDDFELILANKVSAKSLNLNESELTGRFLLQIMPESKVNNLFDIYVRVVEAGEPIQLEKLFMANGSKKWFFITVVKLEDGFVATFADITQQKLQRIVTEERKMLLNEAEALAKMGSWKWNRAENEMVWSEGLYTIMGQSPNDIPSWNAFLQNVYPEDYSLVEKFIADVRAHGKELEINYRILVKGVLHYVFVTSKAQTENTNYDVIGTMIDITQQKSYEKQLEQYNTDLKRSNEDLEQFAYVASHDLQEPLRKIRAFGDRLFLNYKSKLEGQGSEYLNRMQSAASRMQALIEDLLSFARVSRTTEAFEQIELGGVVQEVLDDLDSQVKREQAIVTVQKVPVFKGDKIQIKRLFQNLISNAIKFHKPDRQPIIEISGRLVKNFDVMKEFNVELPAFEFVRITVKDNGIGFDKKYAERIFNIFQRLHGRTEYEGTGIGLAICRKIVSNHGGIINATSEEHVGSEFTIILPVD